MNLVKILPLTALLLLSACDAPQATNDETVTATADEVALSTQAQKISYLLGLDNGNNIKSMDIEFDTAAFQSGLNTALAGEQSRLNEEQIAMTIQQFEADMKVREEAMQLAQQEMMSAQSDGNATDVGDLTQSVYYAAGQSSTASGYTSGGRTPSNVDTIDKFPFASDGNATDVGDLTTDFTLSAGQQG